jgi:1,4-dihydroxy-2-naphthoate octaprenyltransferase
LDKDKDKKVYTLPVLLGEKLSRYITIFVLFLQIVLVVVAVFTGVLKLPVLVVLLALPKYLKTVRLFLQPKPSEPDPVNKTTWPLYFASFAFVYNRRFSLLFLSGLILSLFYGI